MRKRRVAPWAAVTLFTVLLASAISVAMFRWLQGAGPPRGEGLPQFTGSPGVTAKGAKLWGSANRNLYAPVDSPQYVGVAAAAKFLDLDDRVYVIRTPDATFVYPEVLLTSYHIVNDTVGGEPLSITYCLLAGSACSLSRRLDNRVLSLGMSGQLYCGNSVLYDRETQTDWLQLNGEPLQGYFYGKARLAAQTLECSRWRRVAGERNVKVLAPVQDMGGYRAFQRDMETERLGQKVVESQQKLDPRLLPYLKGIGITVQGDKRFYVMNPGGPRRVRNETLGGWDLILLEDGDPDASRVFRRKLGSQLLSFDLVGGVLRDRETGSTWNNDGRCVSGKLQGTSLDIPYYSRVYWFVWSALYPETQI
ncbi:MAG TPA: DUF3179 domain-containing (seleno)protein [Planctomycetota bacterium]|jgi:hypothetical protein|nr:DUF3179 domain-containing (seleno)protein [Planctomycetota bacterium]